MADTVPKRSWFRPGGIILMLVVAGLFVWGNLSYRGASARDSLCVDREVLRENPDRLIYVKGLPFACFVEHVWGGQPHREALFLWPLLLNIAACAAIMASTALAWSIWRSRPGRKAWLQYHLSTAVILMLLAGLLLGASFHPSSEGGGMFYNGQAAGTLTHIDPYAAQTYIDPYRNYGWPLPFWEIVGTGDWIHHVMSIPPGAHAPAEAERFKGGPFRSTGEAVANLVYDVLACLGIVLFVGLICEAWIVWRAKRRKESVSP